MINRYDVPGVPFLFLFVAFLVSGIRIRLIQFVVLVVFFLSGINYTRYLAVHSLDADRENIEKIAHKLEPTDIVIYTGLSKLAADYYLNQFDVKTGETFIFPEIISRNPGAINLKKLSGEISDLGLEAQDLVRRICLNKNARIVLFYTDDEPDKTTKILAPLKTEIEKKYILSETFEGRRHVWGPFYNKVLFYDPRVSEKDSVNEKK